MVAIPRNSQIHDYSTNAYFSDCFLTNIPYNGESALEIFLSIEWVIFSIYKNSEYEVILEDQDKHLGVKISLFIEPLGQKAKVYLSTVVHVNNMLGKVYMLFVVPVHKIIVPTVLHTLPKK